MVTGWYTGGRGAEGAYCTYDLFTWCYASDTLRGEWNQKKVGNNKLVHFVSAEDGFPLDWFHAMACFRVVGNARRVNSFGNNDAWMFKNLAYASNPTEYINAGIRSISYYYKKDEWNSSPVGSYARKIIVRELDEKSITSTSFRSGAANHVLLGPGCEFKHVIAITGHDHTNICAAFEYLIVQTRLVLEAQRVLAGWTNVRGRTGQAPVLTQVIIHFANEGLPHLRRFTSFMKDVLNIDEGSPLDEDGLLWSLSTTLMASLLQYLSAMIHELGADDLVVVTICQKAKEWGYKLDDLVKFGSIVHDDWTFRNFTSVQAADDHVVQACISKMEAVLAKVGMLSTKLEAFEKRNDEIAKIQSEQSAMLKKLFHMAVENATCRTSNSTPISTANKRKREQSPVPESISSVLQRNDEEEEEERKKGGEEEVVPRQEHSQPIKIKQLPLYNASSLKSVSVAQILVDFNVYELHRHYSQGMRIIRFVDHVQASGNISKIKKVVYYAYQLAGKERKKELTTSPPDRIDFPDEYMAWKKQLQTAAEDVQLLVMNKLLVLEKQQEQASSSASSSNNGRATRAPRQRPEPMTYVMAVEKRITELVKDKIIILDG